MLLGDFAAVQLLETVLHLQYKVDLETALRRVGFRLMAARRCLTGLCVMVGGVSQRLLRCVLPVFLTRIKFRRKVRPRWGRIVRMLNPLEVHLRTECSTLSCLNYQ